jgi:molecular chaperone GrpE
MSSDKEREWTTEIGLDRDGSAYEERPSDRRTAEDRFPANEVEAPREEGASEDLANRYLDQLQRLKAEFDNYRKRIAREKEGWWRESRASVLSELLPVVDDVKRARAFSQRAETLDPSGLVLILKNFATAMSKLGLEEMDTSPGTGFDPELHEAVLAVPSEVGEGRIVETVEPGYLFEGQILRRGKVTVSSGSPPE